MLVERIFVQINFCTYDQIFVCKFRFISTTDNTPTNSKNKHWQNGIINHFELENQYALVIAHFRVQYDIYFASFFYFADLLHELLNSEITAKSEKLRKYWPYYER